MLFQSRFHDPIRHGEITCTVRVWHQPRVKVGGRYGLGAGAIVVERIHEVDFDALTPALARRCGFASLADLLKTAKHGAGERVFLIDFRFDDAPASAPPDTRATASSVSEAVDKLAAMDRRAGKPWTREILQLIAANPGVRAVELAASLERPRDDFKADVRKLKALGLTISLEIGYRLSPLGIAVLKQRA